MTSITEFILARVAEDEAEARALAEREEAWAKAAAVGASYGIPTRLETSAGQRAECEAKRRIVDIAWNQEYVVDGEWGSGRSIEEMKREGILPPALCALAAIWADHAEYQESWR